MVPRRIARASVARWRRIWADGNVGTAIAGASRPAVGSENDHAGRDDEYRAGNSELSRRCSRGGCEGLSPRDWSGDDWRELFRFTGLRRVGAADALIRRGDPDRTLYFVLRGNLEVVIHSGDGLSMGPLTRVGAGSVLGEQSFFDGKPRSASVWAVDECEVAAMTPEQYADFAAARPGLARELLFALGRILAIRLRRTTAKVMG